MSKKLFFISIILINIFPLIKNFHRFEPYQIFNNRNKFILKNFNSFSEYIEAKLENKEIKCIVKKEIPKSHTKIFSFNKNFILSSEGYFPLKTNITDYLKYKLTLNNNYINNIALSLRILYELKGNLTYSFRDIKINHKQEIEKFKKYLKERPDKPFIVQYIHNLPLSSYLNLMSWTNDNIIDYKLSGIISPSQNFIRTLYETFVEKYLLDKTINHWLNNENKNLFFSIYQYVNVYSKNINGNSVLIPYLDICKNANGMSKLDFKFSNIKDAYEIYTNSSYNVGNEFRYRYNDDMSNDNFLLYYGFIIKKNTQHNFLFKFDVVDIKFNFYKFLVKNKFDMNFVKIINDNTISVTFPLNLLSLNENLFKFLLFYNDYETTTTSPFKTNKERENYKFLKIYSLYFSTIYKNIISITDNMKTNFNQSDKYINYLLETQNTTSEIKKMDEEIAKLDNGTIISHFENLYYYNHLHEVLNTRNIHIFNLENLLILFNHMNYLYEDLISYQWKEIINQRLINKYITNK